MALTLRAGLAVLLAATLGACAVAPKTPRPESAEYRRSWGLEAVNVRPAYLDGATGRGVTVALIDCGLDDAQPEVRRNVSGRSIDLVGSRTATTPRDRHADLVAGPLGSALDGRGLVGVAYNATLLSVRADFDGGFQGQCAFRPADLARALDYAVDSGAQVVIMPLQARKPLGAPFERALKRTVDSGVAVVIAAGNGGDDAPSYPARYAADPRFEGGIVTVGALGAGGDLAGWSNRAGPAAEHFLMAPGEGVITDCDAKWCRRVSGTSVAAPYVGGALALILERWPKLDGRGAISVLTAGAQDRGDVGTDKVYGRGVLDIGGAFALARRGTPSQADATAPL